VSAHRNYEPSDCDSFSERFFLTQDKNDLKYSEKYGEFQDVERNGYGTFSAEFEIIVPGLLYEEEIRSVSERYEGNWKKGNFHGEGKYTFEHSAVTLEHTGIFEDNEILRGVETIAYFDNAKLHFQIEHKQRVAVAVQTNKGKTYDMTPLIEKQKH